MVLFMQVVLRVVNMAKFEYIKGIGVDIDGTVFYLNLIQDYVNKFFPQYSTKNLVAYQRSVTLWIKYRKKNT